MREVECEATPVVPLRAANAVRFRAALLPLRDAAGESRDRNQGATASYQSLGHFITIDPVEVGILRMKQGLTSCASIFTSAAGQLMQRDYKVLVRMSA